MIDYWERNVLDAAQRHEAMLHRLYAELVGVGPSTIPLLLFLGEQLKHWRVTGPVCEIGLMQGVYLIILSLLADANEKIVGLDVFEDQQFNVDQSGVAQEQVVRDNISRFVAHPDNVELVRGDSTGLRSLPRMMEFARRFGELKVVSVDGCHTKQHTMCDIDFGANMLANGGLLIIDDFTNDGWTGVIDGTSDYFATRNVRLAPIAACFNKLICTTISHHGFYLAAIDQWTRTEGFQRHYGVSKTVTIYGCQAMHLNEFRRV